MEPFFYFLCGVRQFPTALPSSPFTILFFTVSELHKIRRSTGFENEWARRDNDFSLFISIH